MKQSHQIYFRVAEGLAGCQQVEFELKNYLAGAMELAKKCIGGKMPFHTSAKDFEKCSLERLTNHFKNYSNDSELLSALKKFTDERNFLAHQALATLKDPEGNFDDSEIMNLHTRLDNVEPEAKRLANAIYSSAQTIWSQVWFDDLTEKE